MRSDGVAQTLSPIGGISTAPGQRKIDPSAKKNTQGDQLKREIACEKKHGKGPTVFGLE